MVQKMQRKVGSKCEIWQQHVHLLSKPSSNGKKNGSSCNIMVLLYWFSKARGSLKYKYDASNFKWIDVDSIISTVTITYQHPLSCMHWIIMMLSVYQNLFSLEVKLSI